MNEKRSELEAELRCLTSALQANNSEIGDWKVIKCLENQLVGKNPPYDMEELNKKRQDARDRIDAIRQELDAMSNDEVEDVTEE